MSPVGWLVFRSHATLSARRDFEANALWSGGGGGTGRVTGLRGRCSSRRAPRWRRTLPTHCGLSTVSTPNAGRGWICARRPSQVLEYKSVALVSNLKHYTVYLVCYNARCRLEARYSIPRCPVAPPLSDLFGSRASRHLRLPPRRHRRSRTTCSRLARSPPDRPHHRPINFKLFL